MYYHVHIRIEVNFFTRSLALQLFELDFEMLIIIR